MTIVATSQLWPFVIVESRLIVTPDFLARRGESDPRIRRLLVNAARVDQARGTALHRRVLTVPGEGAYALAYRYVPVPGGARDEATRVMHMAEGVVCDDLDAELTDETLNRTRGYLLGPVRRYVDQGWSGPPLSSRAVLAGEPVEPTRWGLGRLAAVVVLAAAGLTVLLLALKRVLGP
jgi:hypothetical protein